MKILRDALKGMGSIFLLATFAYLLMTFAPVNWSNGPARSPVMPAFAQLQYPLGPYANLGFTNNTFTATGTVPAFGMVGLITANSAGAITLTTDTATNICTLFPFVGQQTGGASNYAWDLEVKQVGAGSVTMAGGTGVTLVGTGTVATVNVRHLKIQLAACPPFGLSTPTPAVNMYSLELSAF